MSWIAEKYVNIVSSNKCHNSTIQKTRSSQICSLVYRHVLGKHVTNIYVDWAGLGVCSKGTFFLRDEDFLPSIFDSHYTRNILMFVLKLTDLFVVQSVVCKIL